MNKLKSICDPLWEKVQFHAKCKTEIHTKIATCQRCGNNSAKNQTNKGSARQLGDDGMLSDPINKWTLQLTHKRVQNLQGSHRVRQCISLKVVARHSLTNMQQVQSLPITCSKNMKEIRCC